jgi:hypothetical protein
VPVVSTYVSSIERFIAKVFGKGLRQRLQVE